MSLVTRSISKLSFLCFFFILCFSSSTLAQISPYISEVRTGAALEGEDLRIEIELLKTDDVQDIILFYKSYGEIEFSEAEMDLRGTSASYVIGGSSIRPPFLEYYFGVRLRTDEISYYPLQVNVSDAPFQLKVANKSNKDQEVVILTPEKNTTLPKSEFFVSVSLLRASDEMDRAKTKIYVNNIDVTEFALFADDLIMFSPENAKMDLDFGTIQVKVETFDLSGKPYHSVSTDFVLISETEATEIKSSYTYRGDVTAESRSEDIRDKQTWYNNLRVNYDSRYQSWELNGNVYVTSEERSNLQPNNRYYAELRGGDWLRLAAGDATPRFPTLVLNGKRVRGFNGSLELGFFNLQATFGEVNRGISGRIDTLYYTDNAPIRSDVISLDSAKYADYYNQGLTRASVTFGSNKRNLLAIRPSFGSGQNFQWGFTYLHSIDKFEETEFGGTPKENVVAGTDMTIAFDDQRFLLYTQAAVSIQNTDISEGELSDERIDSLFGPGKNFSQDPKTVKDLKKIIGSIITFNQYIEPLNVEEMPTLAAEATLSLNYFNNYFRGQYLYRGNDFQSFGNTFVRTDVAGINITDRLRLVDNTVFLAVGYENLSDNLQKTKFATTTFQTISTSVSYFPRFDFPSFLVSYSKNENTNDATDSIIYVNDATNRISAQISYDFKGAYKTQAAVGFSLSERDDQSISNFDVTNNSINLSSNTNWSQDFVSSAIVSINNSKIQTQELNYVTLTLGGRWYTLDNKLIVNGSVNPSFGDFKRTALELYGSYYLTKYLLLQAQLRYIINSPENSITIPNDFISGLQVRYNLN